MAFDHNFARVLETADAITDLSNDMLSLLAEIDRALKYNTAQEINWATPGSEVTVDADGNVSGRNYTPAQVSNAIGSLDWVRKLLTNQTMTGSQGDHQGNLAHLAKPLG